MGIIKIHFGHCVGKYGPGTFVPGSALYSSGFCLLVWITQIYDLMYAFYQWYKKGSNFETDYMHHYETS